MKNHLLFLCLLLFARLEAQNTSDWEFKGEKDGIKVYHRKSPGLLHIKLTTSIKVPLSGIVALFSDVDHYKDWGYKMIESRLLNRVSPMETWYYAKYDFPWPFDDRDIILRSVIEQDPVSRKIKITNTPYPSYLPENKGIERIKKSATSWLFVPGADGWVYVEQEIATDSAEDMPEWLIDMTVDTGPRETAKAVRKLLMQERFQQMRLAHVKD